MNEKTMFQLTYGLFVLTAREGEKDNGCIINTAGQVTASPNRISIAVNKGNYTHDMILRTGQFTLSILSEDADFSIFQRFGFQSGRDTDKFAGYPEAKRGTNGILYVTEGTNGYICGKVEQTLDLGTHTLFIASVEDMDVLSGTPSTTYAYYHAHIKPQPAAAPSSAEKTGKTVWRCTICGYIYEGEELPADFICPICKHPASDFEKVEQ
ncbi:MAG TPA: flavin reductase [Candidatus Ventrimonas merdavium]|nr:flavin reductase [Candidatus Ventrimonas merdavium]